MGDEQRYTIPKFLYQIEMKLIVIQSRLCQDVNCNPQATTRKITWNKISKNTARKLKRYTGKISI